MAPDREPAAAYIHDQEGATMTEINEPIGPETDPGPLPDPIPDLEPEPEAEPEPGVESDDDEEADE